jgi:ATPase subunit of ABC transporter with duplicated ATPase domains
VSGSLRAQNVSVSRGAVVVLDRIDLTIGPGDRVGIVGPNGVGKTTLLRALAGELPPEAGAVTRHPATVSVVAVPQEPDARAGERLVEYLARRTGVAEVDRRLRAATDALAGGRSGADDEYAVALESWLALGGADLAERAEAVCAGLGLAADVLDGGADRLSGGESARLRLATALLVRSDILLLDEPTNDLDMAGLAQLEDFVRGFPGGIALVSHDREFCARILNRVLDIDEFTHRGNEYSGGWQAYIDERAAARARAEQAYEAYSHKREELTERAHRQREWARSGAGRAANPKREQDKHIRYREVQRSQRTAAKAATTERELDRLDAVEEPRDPWELRLQLATAGRGSEVVFSLRAAVIERGEVRLGPLDLTITAGDRVRISGPNGSGKSTLIDALVGRLPLVSGTSYVGPGVVVGEMDQTRITLRGDKPLLDVFREITGLSIEDARTLLAKFRIGADVVLRSADSLSPGERTRTGLALFQACGSNCLILDEPTNHLDLPAIEQLESALQTYEGTLLLVTHDRRLAENVAVTREIEVPTLLHSEPGRPS